MMMLPSLPVLVLGLVGLAAGDSAVKCSASPSQPACGKAQCDSPSKTVTCEPCDSSKRPLTVNSALVVQKGHTVNGGYLDLKAPTTITINVDNGYGKPLNKPVVDIQVSVCSYLFGKFGCKWHALPTLGLLNNLDACSTTSGLTIKNCHFTDDPTVSQISMNVDLSSSDLSSLIPVVESQAQHRMELTVTVIESAGGPQKNQQITLGCVKAYAFVKKT